MDALAPVGEAVDRLIDEDRPVRSRFVEADELARLELRKPPPDVDRVRIVDIEGFDRTPCGGTHVTHTAQIGLLVLQSVERKKGGSRITFAFEGKNQRPDASICLKRLVNRILLRLFPSS